MASALAARIVAPTIDESKWPIVIVTMPRQAMSDAELRSHFDRLTRLTGRGSRHVLIVDVRQAPPLSPDQRRMVAGHLDSMELEHPQVMRGVGIVLKNSVQRGIAMVLTWLASKPYRMESFTSLESAEAWAMKRLVQPAASTDRHPPGPLAR